MSFITDNSSSCKDNLCRAKLLQISREKLYTPPPPHFWLKGTFQGRGWGCIFWGPARQEFYMPPPFIHPPTPRRVFSGVGGWGCIKFGPVRLLPVLPYSIPSAQKNIRDGKYNALHDRKQIFPDLDFSLNSISFRCFYRKYSCKNKLHDLNKYFQNIFPVRYGITWPEKLFRNNFCEDGNSYSVSLMCLCAHGLLGEVAWLHHHQWKGSHWRRKVVLYSTSSFCAKWTCCHLYPSIQ